MQPFGQNRHPKTAFSLIELMVVLAIVSILAALLLPALDKGKSRSQTLSCLNNLKQLQASAQMYTDDHSGELPLNNFNDKHSANPLNLDISWCPGNARTDITTTNIEQGLLFPYNRSAAIYHCPADLTKAETADGKQLPQLRTRSYQMSASINSETADVPFYKKFSEITSPSSIFVFLDALGENACFVLYPTTKVWTDLPGDRHYQGGNFSFADGHVERWKWRAPKDFNQKMKGPSGFEDWEDMKRLQAGMKP